MVYSDFNVDTLSYCCLKLDCCSSSFDSDCNESVTFSDEGYGEVYVENQLTCGSDSYDVFSHEVDDFLFDCDDTMESFGVVSKVDVDDMCEYKSNYSFDCQLVAKEKSQIQGMNEAFYQIEYEHFIFLLDSMHGSVCEYVSQFYISIHGHVDMHFHSKPTIEVIIVCLCTMKVMKVVLFFHLKRLKICLYLVKQM